MQCRGCRQRACAPHPLLLLHRCVAAGTCVAVCERPDIKAAVEQSKRIHKICETSKCECKAAQQPGVQMHAHQLTVAAVLAHILAAAVLALQPVRLARCARRPGLTVQW